VKFAESVYDLVDSESYEHFGKVCIESHSYLDGIIAASLSSPTLCSATLLGELHVC
jgi:hypothetical protein